MLRSKLVKSRWFSLKGRLSDKECAEELKKAIQSKGHGLAEDRSVELATVLKGIGHKIHVVVEGLKAKGDVGVRTYTAGIMLCAGAGNDRAAVKIFEKMRGEGVEPDRQSLKWLMKAGSRQGNIPLVESTYKLMRKKGFCRFRDPSYKSFVFCSLVSGYNAAGEYDKAMRVVEEFVKIERVKFTKEMGKAVLGVRPFEKVKGVLGWVEEEAGVVLDEKAFVAVLRSCVRPEEAKEVVGMMRDRGLTLDKHCWHEVLLTFVRARDAAGAVQIANHIHTLNFATSLTHRALLTLCTSSPSLLELAHTTYLRASTLGFSTLPAIANKYLHCLALSSDVPALERHRRHIAASNISEHPSLLPLIKEFYVRNGLPDQAASITLHQKSEKTHDVHSTLVKQV